MSFCSGTELEDLKAIEKLIGFMIPLDDYDRFYSEDAEKGLVDGVPAAEVKKRREAERMERIRKYKESKKSKNR